MYVVYDYHIVVNDCHVVYEYHAGKYDYQTNRGVIMEVITRVQ